MASISLNLDRDLEARVKRYADGIGVPLEDVIERAIVHALSSRYPDNSLPGGPPGRPGRPSQGLPKPPFDGTIDNELPEGEVPVDPGFGGGIPAGGGRPDQGLPDVNPNPNFDPDVDKDAPRPGHGLPPTPEPKA